MGSRKHISLKILLVVIVVLLGGVFLGAALHSQNSISGPEVASVWTSTILTLFLAFIYYRQNNILELQSRIMAGSHTPILSVAKSEFTSKEPKSGNALRIANSGEFLKFSISNEGNDIAKNLRIMYIPAFKLAASSDDKFRSPNADEVCLEKDSLEAATPFKGVDSDLPPLFARVFPVFSTDRISSASDTEGATVSTKVSGDTFYAQSGFYIFENNVRKPIQFVRAINKVMDDDNISSFVLGRILWYENPYGDESYLTLPSLRFKPSKFSVNMSSDLATEQIDAPLNYYTEPEFNQQIEEYAKYYNEGKQELVYFEAE